MKLSIFILLAASPLMAQTAQPSQPQSTPTPAVKADSGPKLLESEKLSIQFLVQQEQELDARRKDLITQENDFIEEIQHNHPGYTLDPKTATLVKAPEKAPEKSVTEKPSTKK